MMFGYASSETPELMPAPIMYAHKLVFQLASVRKKQPALMPYLRPDAKSQVTVEYDSNGKPIRVDTVVVSTQHDPDVTQKKIKEDVIEIIVRNVIPSGMLDNKTRYFVNPTGRFEVGGTAWRKPLRPGAKLLSIRYGGRAPHGRRCILR